MPEISVIICTRNRADIIPDALNSLKNQSLIGAKYEVIVIDQSTDYKTADLLKNYPDYRYIKLDSRGIPYSRNEGFRQATGDIIVYVDDDVFFSSDYLENILSFFRDSELSPDIIGGKTCLKFLSAKPDWITGSLLGVLAASDFGEKPNVYDNHPKHVPYTCNIAIKRECLEKVGGFSSRIIGIDPELDFGEDVIFANQARNLGYNLVYCPKMLVHHKIQQETPVI